MALITNEDIRFDLYEDALEELRCNQPELRGHALVMEACRLVDERFMENQ